MNIQSSSLRGWQLFSLISMLIVVMSALAVALQPELIDGLRSAIRATARTSFVLFLTAFTASAFAVLVPSPLSKALVRERRFIGLAFAFSHFVHAALIYAYGQLNTEFWPARSVVDNIPGSTGYLLILLMTLTSFKAPARLLGPKAWKALHVTGMWVIVAVFAFSNFKRIPMSAWYVLPFGLICAAVAIRLVGKLALASKRRQAPRPSTRNTVAAS
ncbi:ferric reductase-like transmembrane domain-containing protein (plasmid) [Pseudomonas sp. R1-18]|uniref:ferric reductase-like transmembrane domain-containing protein n=1 Tax=Pseudomonas sp. R1-18 TaxID=1632772 RepID=UPI003DA873AC